MTQITSQAQSANAPRNHRIAGSSRWRDYRDAYILMAPAVLLFVGFVIYPLVRTVILSFYDYGLTDPRLEYIGLQNYMELMEDQVFWRSIQNNMFILVGSVIVQVGLGLVLAAVLSRGIRWGKTFFRTLHFAPVVMSAVAVGVLWQLIYDPGVGAINAVLKALNLPVPTQGWLGDPNIVMFSILIAASWQYTGYMMTILLAGMQSVPEDLYEASSLDGANEVQNFMFITFPMIRNVVLAATLITMIGAIKVFDIVFVLTRGGPANSSQVMGTYIYYNAFTINRAGYASAIGTVLLLFALILGLLQLRFSRRV